MYGERCAVGVLQGRGWATAAEGDRRKRWLSRGPESWENIARVRNREKSVSEAEGRQSWRRRAERLLILILLGGRESGDGLGRVT